MIRDLSESLQAVLTQPGLPPELSAALITFDRPTDPFTPAATSIDLFLFDVREDVDYRSNETEIRRENGQAIISRAPFRVLCTYLITAWAVDGPDIPLQEQRLLTQVLQVLAQFPIIPPVFLQGSLATAELPVHMTVAHPDDVGNPSEFWLALGNRMKPSIIAAITIPLPVFPDVAEPLAISSTTKLQQMGLPATMAQVVRIGGLVLDAAANPVAGATVQIVGRSRTTTSNADGVFSLAAIPPGNYTLRATSGALTKDKNITVPAPVGSDYDVQFA